MIMMPYGWTLDIAQLTGQADYSTPTGCRGGGGRGPSRRSGQRTRRPSSAAFPTLAGAAAVTVDGELFVVGGDSPAATRPTPGVGITPAVSGSPGRGLHGVDDLGLRPHDQAAAGGRPPPGAGIPCRGPR